ncbi:hypothetical protein ElyMa_005799100 [Elysia marginata]|uniref:Uncharacterized protein n=1 Tax=Elysia marginata TaxID=1093978 RepID=A0AAV4FTB3_9GAST|nr:hypothetical protein ElyMa_005799100 [Elysia marginata]
MISNSIETAGGKFHEGCMFGGLKWQLAALLASYSAMEAGDRVRTRSECYHELADIRGWTWQYRTTRYQCCNTT